jgi:lipoprotein-releasing system permease protein
MSFSRFVSKKYSLSKKDSKFVTFISAISISGIALGVATLIIALSILNGFEKTITSKIVDFDSHIQITSYKSTLPNYHEMLPRLKEMVSPLEAEINPYASKLSIISSKKGKDGINLKGILDRAGTDQIKQNLIEGKFSLTDSISPSIIIGKKLADKLLLKVGDPVTIFALSDDQMPSIDNLPNIQKFVVAGIFESGMAEYDDLNAYVSLFSAQNLFEIGDNITGYDLRLNDVSKIDSITTYLSDNLRYPHAVRSIYQIHRNIFTWIELQKKPIPIVLGLLIIVAVFNIIGTLLMIVLEKTNAIGTLKALGARNKQIILIFVYQGIFLALIGIILGNIIALLLMGIQLEYNIISIPSSVYFMSSVPIELSLDIFIGISLLTFILCIAAASIPSFIASKIKPVTSLRFS